MVSTLAAAFVASLGCTHPLTSDRELFPQGWRFEAGGDAFFARNAMVASQRRLASEAGVEILRAGGNAVDAAVAVGFALAVVLPEAGNIGGGGYMLIRMKDGRLAAIDYREMAPTAARADMYLDASGNLTAHVTSGRAASGVPGAVAGMAAALERFGTMPLSRVMQPAIRLAAQGFPMDSATSATIEDKRALISRSAGAELFLPGGVAPPVGKPFVQRELAGTLERIARQGPAAFYRGAISRQIVAELGRDCPAGIRTRDRAANGCGVMGLADLANYQPAWRTPLRTTYRNYTVIGMPPSSSGGVTIAETLNILEGFRLPRAGSAEHAHLVASSFQRAFVDRNETLGDPAFVRSPIERLTSKDYAAQVRRTVGRLAATPTRTLMPALRDGDHTTHYSVVDSDGNAVATTTTINSLFGSGVFVRGAGFFLNNEMDDFTSRPGTPNQFGLVQGRANAIAPGKRMLSAMSPTIVLDPAGELFLALGGRGGPRIITSVTQVIVNMIDHRMSLADAMAAPRIHHQALPDVIRYEQRGMDSSVLAALQRMGYTLAPNEASAVIAAIARVPGGYQGMDDPRSPGAAAGY